MLNILEMVCYEPLDCEIGKISHFFFAVVKMICIVILRTHFK